MSGRVLVYYMQASLSVYICPILDRTLPHSVRALARILCAIAWI